jgi:hypothetical protein
MSELTAEEASYLLAAFTVVPREWFRPHEVARSEFGDRAIDRLVESLVRRGLMDGDPERHVRLTDPGRREAAQLGKLASRDWPRFHARRRVRIAVAATVAAVCVVLVLLKATSVL